MKKVKPLAYYWFQCKPNDIWEIVKICPDGDKILAIGCNEAMPISNFPKCKWGAEVKNKTKN